MTTINVLLTRKDTGHCEYHGVGYTVVGAIAAVCFQLAETLYELGQYEQATRLTQFHDLPALSAYADVTGYDIIIEAEDE